MNRYDRRPESGSSQTFLNYMCLGCHECPNSKTPKVAFLENRPALTIGYVFKVKSAKVWTPFPFHGTLFQMSRPLLLTFSNNWWEALLDDEL